MDTQPTNETEQDAKNNTVLVYTTIALAGVGAVVIINKTILYTRAIVTVAKARKAEKALHAPVDSADPS